MYSTLSASQINKNGTVWTKNTFFSGFGKSMPTALRVPYCTDSTSTCMYVFYSMKRVFLWYGCCCCDCESSLRRFSLLFWASWTSLSRMVSLFLIFSCFFDWFWPWWRVKIVTRGTLTAQVIEPRNVINTLQKWKYKYCM